MGSTHRECDSIFEGMYRDLRKTFNTKIFKRTKQLEKYNAKTTFYHNSTIGIFLYLLSLSACMNVCFHCYYVFILLSQAKVNFRYPDTCLIL